jgi:hypothetical protein
MKFLDVHASACHLFSFISPGDLEAIWSPQWLREHLMALTGVF